MSVSLFVSMFPFWFACLFVGSFVCLFVCLSVCLFVCLFVCLLVLYTSFCGYDLEGKKQKIYIYALRCVAVTFSPTASRKVKQTLPSMPLLRPFWRCPLGIIFLHRLGENVSGKSRSYIKSIDFVIFWRCLLGIVFLHSVGEY